MSAQARTEEAVRAVASMGLSVLRVEWRRRWGDVPAFRSRDLMARAMAYRLQSEAFGGLPQSVRRKLAEHAAKLAGDRKYTPTPGPVLKPGSSLIREWRGVRHEVAVIAEGFAYQGETFRSLSQVAQRITGVKWNGLVFFGLKARAGKAA
jgi:hypothetical protein